MSNSINIVENQKGGSASVAQVRLLLQNSEIRKMVIALIEGPDDKRCYERVFSDTDVFLLPMNIRFHEKVITTLLPKYPDGLISIKDADFLRVNGVEMPNENMFLTDAHDLETMILKGGNLSLLAADFPDLVDGVDELFLCHELLKYSYLKWYNYTEHTNLAFDRISVIDLYNHRKLSKFDELFQCTCVCSSTHTACFGEYLLFVQSHPTDDVLSITNGHDLMECIYIEMHKRQGGNLKKKKVLKSFYQKYSLQLFRTTDLFTQLYNWGQHHDRSLFAASIDEQYS